MVPLPLAYHFLLCLTTLIFDVLASIRLAPDEKDLQIALLRQQLRVLERKIKKKPRTITIALLLESSPSDEVFPPYRRK